MENKYLPNEQSEDQKKIARKIIQRFEVLKQGRTNFENRWQEAYDYCVPRKADVTTQSEPGSKKGSDLFDSTAITSNLLLAGAMHGMLTNPMVKFLEITMGDPSLDDDEEVREWTEDTSTRMFHVLNNSNFQTEIHETYIDQGAIGTACLYMGEHDTNVIHFSARPMSEVYIDESNLGVVDTVYRCFKWNARQIVQEFGIEGVPEFIGKIYEQGGDDKFEIIHAVETSIAGGEKKKVFPFSSTYILKEKAYVLAEKGYKEFPYAAPRWTKVTGEVYGRGPGMEVLSDIKMVNRMMEVTLKGAQKTIDPPLMVSDDGVIGNVRLTPGGLTVVRPSTEVPIRPLITDARVDFGYQVVEDVRKRIRVGFYGDLFQLREGPQMTATEVNTIAEQQMRLMGPIMGRQHHELLRVLAIRLFGIMSRRGMLKPPPAKIQGKSFDVRYSSLIARSQRMGEGQNLVRAIAALAPIIQMAPEVVDNLDTDKTFKYGLDIYGAPAKLLRTQDAVGEIRTNRAEAQQAMVEQQQQTAQAEQAGKVLPGVAQMAQASQKG